MGERGNFKELQYTIKKFTHRLKRKWAGNKISQYADDTTLISDNLRQFQLPDFHKSNLVFVTSLLLYSKPSIFSHIPQTSRINTFDRSSLHKLMHRHVHGTSARLVIRYCGTQPSRAARNLSRSEKNRLRRLSFSKIPSEFLWYFAWFCEFREISRLRASEISETQGLRPLARCVKMQTYPQLNTVNMFHNVMLEEADCMQHY